MSYLLDTNVLSETVRPHPAPSVSRWLRGIPNDRLYLSVLTLGEIRKGVERLPDPFRRERLRLWLEKDIPAWFGGRLLPVEAAVADHWGRLLALAERTPPAVDSLIAATALHYDLRLVTRNVRDFPFPGLERIDPWQE